MSNNGTRTRKELEVLDGQVQPGLPGGAVGEQVWFRVECGGYPGPSAPSRPWSPGLDTVWQA